MKIKTGIIFEGKLDNVNMGCDQAFGLKAIDKKGRTLYLYGICNTEDSDTLEYTVYDAGHNKVATLDEGTEGNFGAIPQVHYEGGVLTLNVEPFTFIPDYNKGDEYAVDLDLVKDGDGYTVKLTVSKN